MGIRPNFHLLCGIDNLQVDRFTITDERFKPTALWEDRHETAVTLPPKAVIDGLLTEKSYAYTDHLEIIRQGWIRTHLTDKDGNPRELSDLIEWDSEYGEPGVIGYRVAEGDYANDVYYALALIDERFQSSGHMVLPSYPLEKDISYGASGLKIVQEIRRQLPDDQKFFRHIRGNKAIMKSLHIINQKKRTVANGWNYVFFGDYMSGYADVAQYLFEQIGLTVPRRDLRLMLVWQWS